MKLIKHLSEVDCSSQNPAFIREALIARGITASIGQVRQTLKTMLATQSRVYDAFNCPICPLNQASSKTHDQTYHDELQFALNELKAALYEIPPAFQCDCGNPTPHITDACKAAQAAEQSGMTPNYHCVICQMYGEDMYADAHGRVWINGACELNRQIAERTSRQDSRMREEMAASAFSTFRPTRTL